MTPKDMAITLEYLKRSFELGAIGSTFIPPGREEYDRQVRAAFAADLARIAVFLRSLDDGSAAAPAESSADAEP